MEKTISVVGGDLRIVKLVELLAKDNWKVYTYCIEKAESISELENVYMCQTLEEAVSVSKIVVGPIPFTSDRENVSAPFSYHKLPIGELIEALSGKKLIAGNIIEPIRQKLEENEIAYIDVLRREELVVLNTISTAEGTIQIAMEETQRTIHGSKVLVMGFGRVGKVLAKMLEGIGAKVTCEARKNEDISWIKAYGYNPLHFRDLNEHLGEFDIIINTIPSLIFDKTRLDLLKNESVLIDLASSPGGVDRKYAKETGKKVIWALSLPGKVAPVTSAEFIKETLKHIMAEM